MVGTVTTVPQADTFLNFGYSGAGGFGFPQTDSVTDSNDVCGGNYLPPDNCCCAYEHPNYAGSWAWICVDQSPGSWYYMSLTNDISWNDVASSWACGKNARMKLCDD